MADNLGELLKELGGIDFSGLGEGITDDQTRTRELFDQLSLHCENISESIVGLFREWGEITGELIPLVETDSPDAMAFLYGHNILTQALIPISIQVTIWGLMCQISSTGADENSPEVAKDLLMIQILSDRLDNYIESLER